MNAETLKVFRDKDLHDCTPGRLREIVGELLDEVERYSDLFVYPPEGYPMQVVIEKIFASGDSGIMMHNMEEALRNQAHYMAHEYRAGLTRVADQATIDRLTEDVTRNVRARLLHDLNAEALSKTVSELVGARIHEFVRIQNAS